MRRGQSTVEFALLVPFLFGLLALTLQGGLLISDQVNLQQYVYDAGQWAKANACVPSGGACSAASAAPDPATGTAGTISQHIYDQLCAPGKTPSTVGSSPLTRFCTNTLSVTTIDQTTPTSLDLTHGTRLADVVDCVSPGPSPTQPWVLSISPNNPQTVNNSSTSGSLSYTITVNAVPAPTPLPTPSAPATPPATPPAFATPTVSLTATTTPQPAGGGASIPSPDKIAVGAANTSTLTWSYTKSTDPNATLPGVYTITVTGADQCGVQQSLSVHVTVGPATVAYSPSAVTDWVGSVAPPNPCATINQTLNISGGGFVQGVTVDVAGATGTVNVLSQNQLQVLFAAGVLPTNPATLTVTWPDGTKAALVGALTPVATCPAGGPPPAPPTPPCVSTANPPNSGAAGVPNELKVTITWKEPLVIPLLSTGAIAISATAYVFCN